MAQVAAGCSLFLVAKFEYSFFLAFGCVQLTFSLALARNVIVIYLLLAQSVLISATLHLFYGLCIGLQNRATLV